MLRILIWQVAKLRMFTRQAANVYKTSCKAENIYKTSLECLQDKLQSWECLQDKLQGWGCLQDKLQSWECLQDKLQGWGCLQDIPGNAFRPFGTTWPSCSSSSLRFWAVWAALSNCSFFSTPMLWTLSFKLTHSDTNKFACVFSACNCRTRDFFWS